MSDLYNPYYPAMPMTMEEVVAELFNPAEKKPFFKGYEPNFYFKQVITSSPYLSEKKMTGKIIRNVP